MLVLVVRRVALAIATVVVATFLTFVLVRLTPGEPAQTILTRVFIQDQTAAVSRQAIDAVARQYGLTDPMIVQYGRWAMGAMHGDLGTSIRTNRAVTTELGWRIGHTLLLAALATVLSVALTFVSVLACRWARRRWPTRVLDGVAVVTVAMPAFYLGVILIIVLSLRLDLLPVSGFSSWAHVVLPVVTLALGQVGFNVSLLSGALDEALAAPYILTARAKGLGRGEVLMHHALPNALVPVIPYVALELAYLIGGVVVVEQLFGVPGIGAYLMEALDSHDVPAFLGTIALIAAGVSLCNLVADILVALIDPRLRFAGAPT